MHWLLVSVRIERKRGEVCAHLEIRDSVGGRPQAPTFASVVCQRRAAGGTLLYRRKMDYALCMLWGGTINLDANKTFEARVSFAFRT